MANVFEPRLNSTSSAENDMDDVFGKMGGGGGFFNAKNRSISDPSMAEKAKVVPREESRSVSSVRGSALSDSSNVVKRVQLSDVGKSKSYPNEDVQKSKRDGSSFEGCLPEPESMRQVSKDFSVLFEEDEDADSGYPERMLRDVDTRSNEELSVADSFANENTFLGDMVFEVSRNVRDNTTIAQTDSTITNTEDDDDLYPEIERFPSGYKYWSYDDFSTMISPPEDSKPVLRTPNCFPELPDDLFQDDSMIPDMELDEVEVPELLPAKVYAFE